MSTLPAIPTPWIRVSKSQQYRNWNNMALRARPVTTWSFRWAWNVFNHLSYSAMLGLFPLRMVLDKRVYEKVY